MRMTEARLSTLLKDEVKRRGLTYEEASLAMDESGNSVSRWVTLAIAPSPDKWPKIADFLGIGEVEVATALALDRIALREARRSL